jgi:hypothetical protein
MHSGYTQHIKLLSRRGVGCIGSLTPQRVILKKGVEKHIFIFCGVMTNDVMRLHYTCLLSPVYLHLSSLACLPAPVYLSLSTFTCLPSPVFLRLSTFACLPSLAYLRQYAFVCLLFSFYLSMSTFACRHSCLSNFAVYLSLSASQAVFLSDRQKVLFVYRTFFLLSTHLPHIKSSPPTRYDSLVCHSFSLSSDMLLFAFPPLLHLSARPFFLLKGSNQ